MSDAENLKRQIELLENRMADVRRIKHQISNELMGVLGHTELLAGEPGLSDRTLDRVRRIREHCDRLQQQANELNRICLEEVL